MSNNTIHDRGQVGIGTLIVFIAMVVVAAIASGVLINAVGHLQTKGAEASEQSSDQVADRVQVFTAVGTQIDDTNETVGAVNLTVGLSPSSDDINLSKATVQWLGPNGHFVLTHDSTTDGDGNFYVSVVRDEDNTAPVLTARDDRLEMSFRPGSDPWGAPIPADSTLELYITADSGATTVVELKVPQAVAGKSTVRL